jgi:hypothetical protein
MRFLESAITCLDFSARAHHRLLNVARTVADLAGATASEVSHTQTCPRLPSSRGADATNLSQSTLASIR